MENKEWQFSLWYVLMIFWLIILIQNFFFAPSRPVDVAYSDFIKLLKADKLNNVLLSESSITANVKTEGLNGLLPEEKIKEIEHSSSKEHQVTTVRINDPSLVTTLEAAKVTFNGEAENKWLTLILSWVVPALLFFILWSFLIKRMSSTAGGVLDVGKSKAKVYMEKETHVSFQDVAGVDEAKTELMEVVEFLKNPQHYTRIGAHIPKGVLLVGPPGTGKTLLARAVAGEAGVPFFSINGSEFVEMFVGVGAARVRDLFIHARETAPAIIFIDELDALGRARGAYPVGGGHDEKEQTLNQLLSEMDGFDPSEGLILIAATNRPEILDPALLRAGRFDRHVLVDRPDKIGRVEILQVHLKKIKQAPDVDSEKIAALTPGFSGADLANLVNEAALLATRHNADSVSMDDFTNAVERIVAGLEKRNRLLNPKERKIVAYHEMGHTIVALSLPNVDQVHKVSIIPRGIGSLGYTIQRPTEDRYLMTEEELKNKMKVLLGGRAAEFIVFDRFSTGAADDLAKATDIARSMVMRYGMDKELGPVTYQKEHSSFLEVPMSHNEQEFSEKTACEIDAAVRKIIQSAFDDAIDLIKKHIESLEAGAQLLLQKETLNEDDLMALNIK
ncbi:protease, ATP-dependent zinc-metallo [Legionella santicrucis]|uniref:ATP-dependent zinc metalloprotease FtsH n=1 Tax=Legionella santicrucis TaxID=45074 RepID=A0A0W0YAV6_9GAMM|nr:ATP-dependent zinc metalloprotease FtsH [Legionella santicrucis]KTD53699.1 protease, ATP-dependent zinc-metallo [Legionella santicrucis]